MRALLWGESYQKRRKITRTFAVETVGTLAASAEALSKIKAAQRTSYIEPPALDTEAVEGPFSLGVLRQD
jgi:hypothetical protein